MTYLCLIQNSSFLKQQLRHFGMAPASSNDERCYAIFLNGRGEKEVKGGKG